MCVSMHDARFNGTTVYAGTLDHPTYGKVHTAGYKNTPINLAPGANAMLLHFPSAVPMTQQNNVDLTGAEKVLDDMVSALKPRSRGLLSADSASKSFSVSVFDSGIYTVVLSANPSLIPQALQMVAPNKRPALNKQIFDWYTQNLKGYSVALCCFDSRQANEADPIFFWYEPSFPDVLMAPGLDAHDGTPPDENGLVEVDHWVVFGSDKLQRGNQVYYTDKLSPEQKSFLPQQVVGRYYHGMEGNADFVVPVAAVEQGNLSNAITRKVLR